VQGELYLAEWKTAICKNSGIIVPSILMTRKISKPEIENITKQRNYNPMQNHQERLNSTVSHIPTTDHEMIRVGL
jgi:hypothetical protein